jgi:iduronate 2-sulfatase
MGDKWNALLILAMLAFTGCGAVDKDHSAGQGTETRNGMRNVVLIIVDDLRPQLGCYGDPIAVSPHLDLLAQESAVFTRAYAQYPICNPSRSSFLSGLRPETTGIYGNHQMAHDELKDTLVINRYLREQGFEVAGIGKVYHGSQGPANQWSQPYFGTEWLDHVRPEHRAIADIYFTPQRPEGQKPPSSWEAEDVEDEAYCDGQAAREAQLAIGRFSKKNSRFFLVVGFRHPHLPWCAPKKYWDLYDRDQLPLAPNPYFPKHAPEVATHEFGELWSYADIPEGQPLTEALARQSLHGYYACISYVDAQIGRIVDKLKQEGLYEETVIAVIGDHGYQLGDNGVWTKAVNWEKTNRTVLMMRVPGRGNEGTRTISSLVELVDIYPTLCEAVDLPVPEHCEGRSLLPLMDNPQMDWDQLAFSQFQRGQVMGRSIRTDRYRFTLWEDSGGALVATELYDLKTDPEGNFNLAGQDSWESKVQDLTRLHRREWPGSDD